MQAPSISTERLVGSSCRSSPCSRDRYQHIPSAPCRKRFQLLGSRLESIIRSRALWALSAAITSQASGGLLTRVSMVRVADQPVLFRRTRSHWTTGVGAGDDDVGNGLAEALSDRTVILAGVLDSGA